MYSKKEIAAMYGCHVETMAKLMRKVGVISPAHGKGKTSMILPLEFEILKSKIGPPRFVR